MTTTVRTVHRRRPLTAAAVVVAFGVLVTLVGSGWRPLRSVDTSVLHGLNDVTAPHPAAVHAWKLVSEVGQPFIFQVLAVLTALALFRRGHRPLAAFTAATVLGAGLLSTIVKAVVGRTRPTPHDPIAHAGGASFPSGHALSSAVGVAVALILVLPHLRGGRRHVAVAVGAAVAALIAFSRLALGVHYVSDVIGGWLLAALWLLLAVTLLERVSDPPPRAPGRPCPDPPP